MIHVSEPMILALPEALKPSRLFRPWQAWVVYEHQIVARPLLFLFNGATLTFANLCRVLLLLPMVQHCAELRIIGRDGRMERLDGTG